MPTVTEVITTEYVLEKLKDIMEDSNVKTRDKLEAIKLTGEYLRMFGRKVEIDFRALVAQLSSSELKGLINANHTIELNPISSIQIEATPVDLTPLPALLGSGVPDHQCKQQVKYTRKKAGGTSDNKDGCGVD